MARRMRNPKSPREFQHQIVVPKHLDQPYVKAYAEKHGITEDEAQEKIRRAGK